MDKRIMLGDAVRFRDSAGVIRAGTVKGWTARSDAFYVVYAVEVGRFGLVPKDVQVSGREIIEVIKRVPAPVKRTPATL